MSIKLVAIDMDETLLRSDKTYDEEKLRSVFSELKSEGIKYVSRAVMTTLS